MKKSDRTALAADFLLLAHELAFEKPPARDYTHGSWGTVCTALAELAHEQTEGAFTEADFLRAVQGPGVPVEAPRGLAYSRSHAFEERVIAHAKNQDPEGPYRDKDVAHTLVACRPFGGHHAWSAWKRLVRVVAHHYFTNRFGIRLA